MSEAEISKLPPKAQREVRKKQQLMARQQQQPAHADAPTAEGCVLPRGQTLARSWIVLDLGTSPSRQSYDPWSRPDDWTLRVTGLKGGHKTLTLQQLRGLGVRQYSDVAWHCVTGWSAVGLQLEGVPMAAVLQALGPAEGWRGALQVSADGYTVNVHREDLESSDAFVCTGWGGGGALLPSEHGGIRIVIPSLFGWKSAKWLSELHFLPYHAKGFWEKLGCHTRGRALEGERWAAGAAPVWEALTWMSSLYYRFGGYTIWVAVMQRGGAALGRVAGFAGAFRRRH
ncbi:Oxidoreductase, molybdopterin-binding domain-containing protein [Tribonema minus]|uniref:Oxidoreductase, molybdopterin-binding domain-containing protein n=1 Tax=Tribonema minus TaxID=303371 RepID=A0A835ZI51_9STRA|nr:Oxidoreductase, molybdopterin-binding domain-containing protein [Tribonema minus]